MEGGGPDYNLRWTEVWGTMLDLLRRLSSALQERLRVDWGREECSGLKMWVGLEWLRQQQGEGGGVDGGGL